MADTAHHSNYSFAGDGYLVAQPLVRAAGELYVAVIIQRQIFKQPRKAVGCGVFQKPRLGGFVEFEHEVTAQDAAARAMVEK